MNKKDNYYYLDICYQLAEDAIKKGNHPFGALLVKDQKIIHSGQNTVVTDNDPTQHAELRLVSDAYRLFGESVLKQCTLYTSTEPCAMCSGAIYWSGISKIVFGCSNKQLSKVVGGTLELSCREVFAKGVRNINVFDYSKLDKFRRQHQNFW